MSVHAVPTALVKSDHPEHNGFIVINESDFDSTKHERYIAPLPPPPTAALPPPPAAPVDPLADLGADWRKRDDLRQIAAAVSGGRSVENKAQAIAVIEAALKARA